MHNQSPTARAIGPPFSHQNVVPITHEQNIICSKTPICRQLFAGHVAGSEKEGKLKKTEKNASNDNINSSSISRPSHWMLIATT